MTVATARVACPCCGGSGEPYADACSDRICSVPGSWSYARCETCRSVWQEPLPAAETIATFYPEDYPFTRTRPEDALARGAGWAQRLKRLTLSAAYGYPGSTAPSALTTVFMGRRAGFTVRFVHARRNGRLLDVGCGNGSFLLTMQRLGWQVEGVEPDPAAADLARRAGLDVQVATVDAARIPEERFDAITLSHVIEHVLNPADTLERLARALKPGGVLVTLSPNPEGLLADRFRGSWFELDCPRHLIIPSRRALSAMAERAGLRPRTFTSMRLFRWAWSASHAIRKTGRAAEGRSSSWRRRMGVIVGAAASLIPGKGEEIVCLAMKPHHDRGEH
jgi:2-polyprenyl-3-methyl-5-hydroxy-6-metoxy-1,4-benzoquinol methylase